MKERIPSLEECDVLMRQHGMLPHIVDHSRQVMRVSLAIFDHLKTGVNLNRNLVLAGALLHDIAKTRSLATRERHDTTGGEMLRSLGYAAIADIVEQHVFLRNFDLQGRLEEREIVYYADKRVMHDRIVTIEERINDLIHRYGLTEEVHYRIRRSMDMIRAVENKIAGFMSVDLDLAVQKIAAGQMM